MDLESVAGGVNRGDFDKMISGLGKRVFLLHNVHESGPVQMATRWTMNYLAGPLTRVQIPSLNKLVGAVARVQPLTSAQQSNPATNVIRLRPSQQPQSAQSTLFGSKPDQTSCSAQVTREYFYPTTSP